MLMLDKELLVFPLLSGIACLLVLASFVGGVFATGNFSSEKAQGDALFWAIGFAYYFVNFFR